MNESFLSKHYRIQKSINTVSGRHNMAFHQKKTGEYGICMHDFLKSFCFWKTFALLSFHFLFSLFQVGNSLVSNFKKHSENVKTIPRYFVVILVIGDSPLTRDSEIQRTIGGNLKTQTIEHDACLCKSW